MRKLWLKCYVRLSWIQLFFFNFHPYLIFILNFFFDIFNLIQAYSSIHLFNLNSQIIIWKSKIWFDTWFFHNTLQALDLSRTSLWQLGPLNFHFPLQCNLFDGSSMFHFLIGTLNFIYVILLIIFSSFFSFWC